MRLGSIRFYNLTLIALPGGPFVPLRLRAGSFGPKRAALVDTSLTRAGAFRWIGSVGGRRRARVLASRFFADFNLLGGRRFCGPRRFGGLWRCFVLLRFFRDVSGSHPIGGCGRAPLRRSSGAGVRLGCGTAGIWQPHPCFDPFLVEVIGLRWVRSTSTWAVGQAREARGRRE